MENDLCQLPRFSLEEIDFEAEKAIAYRRRASRACDNDGGDRRRRSRVQPVVWQATGTVVAFKEVFLCAEDTFADVRQIGNTIAHVMQCAQTSPSSSSFLSVQTEEPHDAETGPLMAYYAVHVDNAHQYQWLMEWCTGSLSESVVGCSTSEQVTESEARLVARQVLNGLDLLHRVAGVVHGDVSPSNILFRSLHAHLVDAPLTAAEAETVRRCRFARCCLGDLESAVSVGAERACQCATCWYTPLEVLLDSTLPASPNADVWAFGVVLFQLLCPGLAHPCLPGLTWQEEQAMDFWSFLGSMQHAQEAVPTTAALRAVLPALLTDSAKDVLVAALQWEATARPSARELLSMAWFHPQRAT